MKPADLLAFGQWLVTLAAAGEVEYRNAARSAYYSVYHLMAQDFGIDTSQYEGRHEAVRGQLFSVPAATSSPRLVEAKRYWDALKRLRVHADYQPALPFDRCKAEDALLKAGKIFSAAP